MDPGNLSGRQSSSQVEALRQQSFRALLLSMALAGWLALQAGYATAPMSPFMWLGVLVTYVGMGTGYVLARRSFRLASIWLLTSLTLALSLLVLAFPRAPLHFFFALIPLVGALIMPALDTWLTLALVAGALLGLERLAPATAVGNESLVGPMSLAVLTCVLASLLSRSLRTAASWALEHQILAQRHAEEARSHRGDLARAYKALDEAWRRLQRMNGELIRAREEAEQARRLKAEFAAHVSHELRTPLNIILGFSRMMFLSPESYDGLPLPPAYRADMQAIYRGSQHLSHLVDDILDLSRVEAGRMRIHPRKLRLVRDVIEEPVTIVRSLAVAKGLELRVEVAEELPAVHGDPVRLRQVLLNLLTNAVRFTDEGHITIRATVGNGAVLVSVADTGRGMATEDVERAFEAFQQVWTQAEPADGTGLGLAISKSLVQLHGGTIWAESQVGKGTTVSFTLPLAEGGSPWQRQLQTPEELARPAPLSEVGCSLVVTPDPLCPEVLERYLHEVIPSEQAGELLHVGQVEEIEQAVEEYHPRAIVVDERLGKSALALCAELPYRVPIVVCSIPSEAETSLLLGAVSHLRKPVEAEALWAAIERLGPQVESILIVDDDRWMVQLLSRLLRTAPRPLRVLEAYAADEALPLMREMAPDAVLLDILMPGRSGLDLLREMKGDPKVASIPVITVSGAGSHAAPPDASALSIALKGRITARQIAVELGAVLRSMPPDYLDHEASTPACPEAPAG